RADSTVTAFSHRRVHLRYRSPLFSHSARAHRDLPSFPTRRSSDLALFRPSACQPLSVSLLCLTLRPSRPLREPFPRTVSVETQRDRKSTRLNSSHVAISYAVFCLKKKKRIVLSD